MLSDAKPLVRRLLQGEAVPGYLDPESWAVLWAFTLDQRLEGTILRAVEGGQLTVTGSQLDGLREGQIRAMERSVSIEALVGRVAERLAANGVPMCVLKGLAACRLDRPAPALRSFFDADLLVRPEHLDRTTELLTSLGARRRFTEPVPGFDRRFGKGVAFTDEHRRELDLHRTLAMGSLGLSIKIDELWAETVDLEVAGRPVLALSTEARLLHACVHATATTNPPRWQTLLDIRAIDQAGFDTERFVSLARSWRYDTVVDLAVRLLEEELWPGAAPQLGASTSRLRPTRFQELTLNAYRRPGTGYASRSLLAVPVIHGWGDRVRFVRALIRPQRHYLASRYGSRRERWKAGATDVLSVLGWRR